MTKAELKEVWTLSKQLHAAQTTLQIIKDELNVLTTKLDGLPRKQSRNDRYAELISRKVDAQNEITELQAQIVDSEIELSTKILDAAELDAVQKKILICRYVQLKQFAEIAALVQYSEAHIYYLHKKAVHAVTK